MHKLLHFKNFLKFCNFSSCVFFSLFLLHSVSVWASVSRLNNEKTDVKFILPWSLCWQTESSAHSLSLYYFFFFFLLAACNKVARHAMTKSWCVTQADVYGVHCTRNATSTVANLPIKTEVFGHTKWQEINTSLVRFDAWQQQHWGWKHAHEVQNAYTVYRMLLKIAGSRVLY